MSLQACKQTLVHIFEYNTPLVLHTNSKTIGITFRLLQLIICLFVFLYYIGYRGGYQAVSYAIITSSTLERKDNGFDKTFAPLFSKMPVVDVKGIENIFFPTATSMVIQRNNSTCQEDPRVQHAECNPSKNRCIVHQELLGGNGVMTGRCLPHKKSGKYTCEIKGWCYVDEMHLSFYDVVQLEDVAILVENHVYFPEFPEGGHLTNFDKSTPDCWAKGYYYSSTHPHCPIFKFRTLAEEAAKNPATTAFTFRDLTNTGGILLIRILWDCNFDINDPAKQCSVEYQYRRMDPVTDVASKGPDFRFVNVTEPVEIRTIFNIYAIRIFVSVEGKARKFDLFTFLTRVGASVGLFAAAALFCEIMLTCACCARERKIRSIKYVEITKRTQMDDNKLLPIV